ncbi:transposase [Streptomyces sp. NPDC004044]
MWVRDRLDGLWRDEDFADWYPRDGRPGLSPAQLATVCVLQFVLGLSDRQAAEAVRCRIDFKYAVAMELDDPGFSPQCAGRLPRPSHRGRPRRPPPRPRAGLPEGGRSGARAHYTAHRLHPRPGRGPRPDPAGDGHRGGPRESTRTVGFPPQELRDLQLRVRAEHQTPEWKTRYAVRSGVEGTVNEFAHGHGMRRCRYRK